jgi:hypothetical protein
MMLMAPAAAHVHDGSPTTGQQLRRLDLCNPPVHPDDVERLVQQHPHLEELCLSLRWPGFAVKKGEAPRQFRLPALPASLKHLDIRGMGWFTRTADLSSLAACALLESLLITAFGVSYDFRLTGGRRVPGAAARHCASGVRCLLVPPLPIQ